MRRILLVDDEENVLVGMRRYFRAAGFEVDCAREREEAEALLQHVHYDCMVLDLCLTPAHGADGLDVIGFVRERCPWVRVVVLSASGAPERRAEATRLGADLYLRKPQPLSCVHSAIGTLLGEVTS